MKPQTALALLILYAASPTTAQEPPIETTRSHLINRTYCLEDNLRPNEICERDIKSYIDSIDGQPRIFGKGNYGQKDKRVSSSEYQDWIFDMVCRMRQTTRAKVEKDAKSKEPGDIIGVSSVYLTANASYEEIFLPLDINQDCFVDVNDDINQDGMITQEDQIAYDALPRDKRAKRIKGYPNSCDKEVQNKEKEYSKPTK